MLALLVVWLLSQYESGSSKHSELTWGKYQDSAFASSSVTGLTGCDLPAVANLTASLLPSWYLEKTEQRLIAILINNVLGSFCFFIKQVNRSELQHTH